MEIIDISMPVAGDMPIYPGDPKTNILKAKTFRKDKVQVSKICMGLHAGTHIDAPLHYLPNGRSIDRIPLKSLTGEALVCGLTRVKEYIKAKDLEKFGITKGDIVFLKTRNSSLPKKKFSKNYVYVSEDAADYLIKKKIKAVGIDYLSIEKYHSKEPLVHKKFLKNSIPIIEGLVLGHVAGGRYLTHCTPLKIIGAEAGPARCVLVKNKT